MSTGWLNGHADLCDMSSLRSRLASLSSCLIAPSLPAVRRGGAIEGRLVRPATIDPAPPAAIAPASRFCPAIAATAPATAPTLPRGPRGARVPLEPERRAPDETDGVCMYLPR